MKLPLFILTGFCLIHVASAENAVEKPLDFATPGFSLVVSSLDADAREAIVRGIYFLLTSWDEAALIEFRSALRRDPSCAMASWGILLSTLGSDHDEERTKALAALRRLAKEQNLLPQERYLCEALGILLLEGQDAAADCLAQYAARFPRDPLPKMWEIVLLRRGYDPFGNARPRQQRALKLVEDLLKKEKPGNEALFLRALLEETAPHVSQRALDCARSAARSAPNHPVFRLLLGHLLVRAGKHGEAAESFAEAASLYERSYARFGLNPEDDDGRIRALLGLAVAQWQQGDRRASLQTRRLLKTFPINPNRINSKRSRLILWEVRSLPARLALADSRPPDAGDIAACMAAADVPGMPAEDPAKPYLWCLQSLMQARLALAQGQKANAQQLLARAESELAELTSPLFLPGKGKDATCVDRAREAVQIALFQTRALATPSRAADWKQDARETARPPSAMLPPPIPMREHGNN